MAAAFSACSQKRSQIQSFKGDIDIDIATHKIGQELLPLSFCLSFVVFLVAPSVMYYLTLLVSSVGMLMEHL